MAKGGILITCFSLIVVLVFVAFSDPSLGNIAKALTSVLVAMVLIGNSRRKTVPDASTSQPKATKVIVIGIALGFGLPVIFIMLAKALA